MFLLHLWFLKGEQTLTTHTVFNTWVTGFKHLFTNLIINQFNVIIGEGQAQTQLVAQHRVWLLVKYVLFKQTPVWAVTHSPRYWVWLDQSEVPFSNVKAWGYRTQVGERKCMEDIWKVTVTEDRRQRHGQGVCLPVRIMKLERRVSSPGRSSLAAALSVPALSSSADTLLHQPHLGSGTQPRCPERETAGQLWQSRHLN